MVDAINTDNINNFVPAANQGSRALNSNYQDFLKLLTTQLKNQDPTSPTDTNQLTQQIATLSQVEQQINTNDNLKQLISLYGSTQYNSVVSYIGKQIEAEGDVSALTAGKAQFAYYLNSEADTLNVTIKDATGKSVYTGTGPKAAGRNVLNWNGKDNNGNQLPDGNYTIEVVAKDVNKNDIISKTFTTGVVTSIDSAAGQVYLSIGDLSIPIQKVTSVRSAPTTI